MDGEMKGKLVTFTTGPRVKLMTFLSLEQPLCHLTYSLLHSNPLISTLAVFLQRGGCSKVKYVAFHPVQL